MVITNKITLAILAAGMCIPAMAQDKSPGKPTHIKIIKIINGDTTIIEKDMNEDELQAIQEERNSIPGRDMRMKIFSDRKSLHDTLIPGMSFLYFNDSLNGECKMRQRMIIDPDSLTPGMMFHFYDSALPPGFSPEDMQRMENFHFSMDTLLFKEFPGIELGEEFMFNDSMTRDLEKHIGYSFSINDDNGEVVVKQFGPKGEKVVVRKPEGRSGEEFSEDVTIRSKDGKTMTRVVVRTTVKIEDIERSPDEKNTSKKEKSELKLHELNFYPNPNNGRFTIDFEAEGKQPVQIRITDMNGKEVYREEVKPNGKHSSQVDLSREGKGTYVLNLQQGRRSTSKKIVIE